MVGEPVFWHRRGLIAWLLWPVSLLFRLIVWLRRRCYATGLCRRWRAPVPVIIIGNITVGGAGKTPLTIALAQMLSERGARVGIVTRGYGGRSAGWPIVVAADTSAEQAGDEAVLLASRTGRPVVAGPDRVAAAKHLLDLHDCDVLLCDDGLQHYRLQRDVEIVVVSAARLFGNGFSLPAGPLRESVTRLGTVDLLVHSGTERQQPGYQLEPEAVLWNVSDTAIERGLDGLQQTQVHAVAGIARPESFFELLRELGLQPIEHPFADHHQFSAADLAFGDDLPVVMTEKDAVKCAAFDLPDCWFLRVHANLDTAIEDALHQLFERLLGESAGENCGN